jgi:hypothetical protein
LCSSTQVPLIQWCSSVLVMSAWSSVEIYNAISSVSSGGDG